MNIVSVTPNTDSVKVRYQPVPGAADYRVYDQENPTKVKYAGIVYLKSGYVEQPSLEIEFNGLTPGKVTTLVVEAVDAIGPICQCTQTDANNNPTKFFNPGDILGSNMGCTLDNPDPGMTINGQGNPNNTPKAIDTAIIVVEATGKPILPSSPLATQVFFDGFTSGTMAQTVQDDYNLDTAQFVLTTPDNVWDVYFQGVDLDHTSVFVMDGHVMAVDFDGGTPGKGGNALHQGWGTVALSPQKTVDFTNGILHATFEVDAHFGPTGRRWCDFRLTPANDPYTDFITNVGLTNATPINKTDTDFMVQFLATGITVDQHLGMVNNNPSIAPTDARIVGAPGQATYTDNQRPGQDISGNLIPAPLYKNSPPYQYGRGLDNRSRFDVFVSATQFAIYEDGILISGHMFTTPMPFTKAKVYFSQYCYHTALEHQELLASAPYEDYWLTKYPHSDERHWDNMGFEVLPPNTSWSSFGSPAVVVVPAPPIIVPPVPVKPPTTNPTTHK